MTGFSMLKLLQGFRSAFRLSAFGAPPTALEGSNGSREGLELVFFPMIALILASVCPPWFPADGFGGMSLEGVNMAKSHRSSATR